MRVKFWGVRGSFAMCGREFLRYGSNTTSVEFITDAGQRLLIDLGTGATEFAKLPTYYVMELKKREVQAAADQAAKTDIGWGHQIRSYVLQPYQKVKDLRTEVETSNTGAVLDGDLDQFMEAALAQKAFGTAPKLVEDVD